MSVEKISSESHLVDIECNFRVSAGPGAGKTHWLIGHIKNTLRRSQRLSSVKKIACITYTNIAVETIMSRIGSDASSIEVSTMHSFLYKHIVKPYISFIADEYNIDPSKVVGHDEIILTNYSFLNEWKTRTNQQRIRDDQQIAKALEKIQWKFEGSDLLCKPDYPIKIDGYAIRTASYLEYKKMAWEKGVIHHDDVLFFSYQIINKFPFTLKVIREKFPYFFIDEFQDSNPIQVEIVRLIGQEETVIGIIGDYAQSIYGFQG